MTSKQTNEPNIISSDFAQEACFDLHKRDLFLRPDQNMMLGIGFALESAYEMQIICLFSSSSRFRFYLLLFFLLIIERVSFEQHTKNYLSGYRREIPDMLRTCTVVIYVPKSVPVPDRCRYRCRYDINTGTGHFGKFGTTSTIPVPDTSVSSVRHYCRYRTLSVSSVYQYRYRTL